MALIKCSECKGTETKEKWYFKNLPYATLCKKCYDRIRHANEYKYRITYKDRRIMLPVVARTGKCSNCGKNGFTEVHHDKYDDLNPAAHIRELCRSCHRRVTWEMGQYDHKMANFDKIMKRDPITGRFLKSNG